MHHMVSLIFAIIGSCNHVELMRCHIIFLIGNKKHRIHGTGTYIYLHLPQKSTIHCRQIYHIHIWERNNNTSTKSTIHVGKYIKYIIIIIIHRYIDAMGRKTNINQPFFSIKQRSSTVTVTWNFFSRSPPHSEPRSVHR